MKTAIVYFSSHHGNTEKVVQAIKGACEVDVFPVNEAADLSGYDRIGIASGVYAGNFGKPILDYCEKCLPKGKEVFFLCTCAAPSKGYYKKIAKIAQEKECKEIGRYHCLGYNTFGPFKLVGGTAKGHPTEEDLQGAIAFYQGL